MTDEPNPDRVRTRADFGDELSRLRRSAGLTVRQLAARAEIPPATVGGYLSAKHLPSAGQLEQFRRLLTACGVGDDDAAERWTAALHRARSTSDARATHAGSPYPGLEPFGTDDAERFFGRDRDVARVVVGLQRLVEAGESPLLAVVGPSGSGKSSLLRAGVVPAIAAGGLDARPASWAVITPGQHPLQALDPIRADPPRLLVVDQFEELFTLGPAEADRHAFLAALSALDPARTLVLIGLRADFYAAATREPLLVHTLQDAQVVLGPMTAGELRQAITGPARNAGAVVEDGLAELLLSELAPTDARGSGHDPGALPLLSHALLATWTRARRNQLTVADYRATGGLVGAVQQTAEEVYRGLDARQRERARRLFQRLVTVDDEAVTTRRRVDRAELDAIADPDDPDAALTGQVLDRFVEHRLLTVDTDSVQVSHEALLTAWPRLRDWLDEDRDGIRRQRQLTHAANAWEGAGRDPGALLRGGRLEAIVEWAADPARRASLNRTERDYLDAAVAQREDEQRRERRHTRRLQRLLAAVAALAVVAALLAVYGWHARSVADAQRADAQTARDNALSRELALEVTRLRASRPALADQLAVAGYRIAHTPQATAALLDASALPTATRLVGPPGPMQALAVNPAGTLLAATGADGQVHLWRRPGSGTPTAAATLRVQPAGQDPKTLFAVAFSPDGRLLATAGAATDAQLWDVSDPAHPRRDATLTGATNTVYSLAFSPDGATLAAGSADGQVHRWSVRTPTTPSALPPLPAQDGYVQAVAFAPTGDLLAAGTADGAVDLWSLRAATPRRIATEHIRGGATDEGVQALAISPDGTGLAAGARDGEVHRWDISDPARPQPRAALTGFTSWVNAVAFSPDGATLAAGSSDQTVRIWSTRTGALQRKVPAANVVTALAFLPGGQRLAGATNEGTALIWPVTGPVLAGTTGHVFAVSFDRDARLLAAGAAGDGVLLWRTDGSRPALVGRARPPATSEPVDGTAAISPDGTLLAAGTNSGPVYLWDVHDPASPRLITTLAGPGNVDEYLTFSPDGHLLAASSDDAEVHLWDVSDPQHPAALPPLTGLGGYVYNTAFSPDGSLLAAPTVAGTVQVWDVHDPRHPRRDATISGFDNYVYAAAFGPDGHTLALGSADKTVRVYDVSDPTRPRLLGRPLTGPTGYVYDVAIGPAGRLLAAASFDGTVWLWNIADPAHPTLVADLTATGDSSVYSVAFAPRGHRLVAGAADGTVHVWTTDPDAVAERICGGAGTPITRAEWTQYVPGAPYDPPCR